MPETESSYEKTLLTLAKELESGQGDGRISLEDAKRLIAASADAGKITAQEERTLYHIILTHNLTEAARKWIIRMLHKAGSQKEILKEIFAEEFRLSDVRIDWPSFVKMGDQQERLFPGKVTFSEALHAVLHNFIKSEGANTFRTLAKSALGITAEDPTPQLIHCINQGDLQLFALNDQNTVFEESAFHTQSLPDDIKIEDYWLFGLRVPQLAQNKFVGAVRRDDYHQSLNFKC